MLALDYKILRSESLRHQYDLPDIFVAVGGLPLIALCGILVVFLGFLLKFCETGKGVTEEDHPRLWHQFFLLSYDVDIVGDLWRIDSMKGITSTRFTRFTQECLPQLACMFASMHMII